MVNKTYYLVSYKMPGDDMFSRDGVCGKIKLIRRVEELINENIESLNIEKLKG